MALSVSITDPPSTDGTTQTRTVGVSLRTAEQPANISVAVELDGDQNGSYRLVKSESGRYDADVNTSVTIEAFIGAQTPYDLRATASATLPSGEVTAEDTITVDEDTDEEQTFTLGGDDPDGDGFAGTTIQEGPFDERSVTTKIGTVEPIATRIRVQEPWNATSNTTQCGEVVRVNNGTRNKHVVIEGVMTLAQYRELDRQRTAEQVPVRDPLLGPRELRVGFDQINVERVDEEETITVDGVEQPQVKFQIQTDENEDQSTFGDESIDAQAFEDTDE